MGKRRDSLDSRRLPPRQGVWPQVHPLLLGSFRSDSIDMTFVGSSPQLAPGRSHQDAFHADTSRPGAHVRITRSHVQDMRPLAVTPQRLFIGRSEAARGKWNREGGPVPLMRSLCPDTPRLLGRSGATHVEGRVWRDVSQERVLYSPPIVVQRRQSPSATGRVATFEVEVSFECIDQTLRTIFEGTSVDPQLS